MEKEEIEKSPRSKRGWTGEWRKERESVGSRYIYMCVRSERENERGWNDTREFHCEGKERWTWSKQKRCQEAGLRGKKGEEEMEEREKLRSQKDWQRRRRRNVYAIKNESQSERKRMKRQWGRRERDEKRERENGRGKKARYEWWKVWERWTYMKKGKSNRECNVWGLRGIGVTCERTGLFSRSSRALSTQTLSCSLSFFLSLS